MWSTRFSWAGDLSGLAMLVVIAAATGTAFYLIGRLDFAGRNPMLAAAAFAAAVLLALTARSGKLSGNRVRRGRPPTGRRARPAPVWHTHPATAAPAAAEATNPTSVQPVATADSTARSTPPADQVVHSLTPPPRPAVHPTPPVAEDQPIRMSPLEAFMAAAGKVHV